MPEKVRLKVVILGDAGVGKTQLTKRYTLNTYKNDDWAKYKPTIGADFSVKEETIRPRHSDEDILVTLQVRP